MNSGTGPNLVWELVTGMTLGLELILTLELELALCTELVQELMLQLAVALELVQKQPQLQSWHCDWFWNDGSQLYNRCRS